MFLTLYITFYGQLMAYHNRYSFSNEGARLIRRLHYQIENANPFFYFNITSILPNGFHKPYTNDIGFYNLLALSKREHVICSF